MNHEHLHIFIIAGWTFVFGFGCGGLLVAHKWQKSCEFLKKRTDEIFKDYGQNLWKELRQAIEKSEP